MSNLSNQYPVTEKVLKKKLCWFSAQTLNVAIKHTVTSVLRLFCESQHGTRAQRNSKKKNTLSFVQNKGE